MEIKTFTPRISFPTKAKKVADAKQAEQSSYVEETESELATNTSLEINNLQELVKIDSIKSVLLNLNNPTNNFKQKHLVRGNILLDELEKLKEGILNSKISGKCLSDLSNLLEKKIEKTSDEKLNTIIRDIETRVKVELAKITKIIE